MTQSSGRESVKTDQSLSTPKNEVKDSQEQSSRGKSASIKKRPPKNQLQLSPTPRSPVIQPGTSGRIPKYSLSVAESPPLHARAVSESSPVIESSSRPNSIPALSIPLPLSQHQPQKGSPTASYYTALSSPCHLGQTQSPHEELVMGDGDDDDVIGKDDIEEVPSSIPWDNSPLDAWPATQPTSPSRRTESNLSQSSSGQFSDGFRVPHPPLSRITSSNFQNESQKSRTRSQRSPPRAYPVRSLFAPSGSHLAQRPSVPHSQDITQSQESYARAHHDRTQSQETDMGHPLPVQKRKREPTIYDLTDEANPMAGTVETPKKPKMYLDASSDSLQELTESQIPPSMRKMPVTVINIHSTQSQTQDWIAPSRPGPTSQDLTKPLKPGSQASFTSSDDGVPSHNWNVSQITASPLSTQFELSSQNGPPPQTLTNPSDTKEPLDLTLGTMYPLESEADGLQDIEALERRAWQELEANGGKIAKTQERGRK